MIYRFADLELDLGQRSLRRRDQDIRLTKLSFDLLHALVESSPNVVSHEELIRKVWGEQRVITPENLTQRVKILRESLGDDSGAPTYIESLRSQGLRLIPDVEVVTGETTVRSRSTRGRLLLPAVFAGVVAIIVFFAQPFFAARQGDQQDSAVNLPPIDRQLGPIVAVLPFVNMSSDTEASYIGDGISEDIIHTLAQRTNLPVIARSSSFKFRDRNLDGREIAKRLNASHFLEGSVRKSGHAVRINAQLIDAPSGLDLWSEQYDVDTGSLFQVQSEIALSIVAKIREQLQSHGDGRMASALPAQEIRPPGHAAPAAYDAYLKGLQARNGYLPDGVGRAIELFEESTELSPEFLPAWRELISTELAATTWPIALRYQRQAYDRIDSWLERAYEYHPGEPLLVLVHGAMRALNHFEWEAGMAEMESVLPDLQNDAFALSLAAFVYFPLERVSQAERLATQALDLDPSLPLTAETLGSIYSLTARTEELRALFERDDPEYFNTVKLGAYLTINGNEAEADAALRKAKTFVPETHTAIQTLQAAHDWYFGDRDKATQVALTLRENRWEQPVSALWVCGGVCMDLHDDWIEQRQHSFAYFVYLNRREAGLASALKAMKLDSVSEPSDSLFHPSTEELQTIERTRIELATEDLDRYVGTYGISPRSLRVWREQDTLHYEMRSWQGTMVPTGEHRFSSLNNRLHDDIRFVPNDDGEFDLCIWTFRGGKTYGYRQEGPALE
jgi:TolB-like protein/DNA-binding winged helix-turn-helix (wHTH) protein